MKNLNQLANWFDTQEIYAVSPCQHLTSLCQYWHSWLHWERAQTEIWVIITRSAWNYCRLQSNHQSPCLHGFTGSRRPQHHLSWCSCTRTCARVISWQNDRLGQYKQVPSLSGTIPSSQWPYSAPELASCKCTGTTRSWNAIFSFCVSTIKIALFQ
jgi:hypothetical protein